VTTGTPFFAASRSPSSRSSRCRSPKRRRPKVCRPDADISARCRDFYEKAAARARRPWSRAWRRSR
jgi:hypothetical protein